MEIEDRSPGYADMIPVTYEHNFRWEDVPGYKVPEYWKHYDDEVEPILRARWDDV
jgi:hypothetical protein